ncbi:Hypothetical protein D9617_3g018540 [Elsinoe fawcettii]|nr:Hypothetical protein D9617_3g018540 [Elsinoe fawcettii]
MWLRITEEEEEQQQDDSFAVQGDSFQDMSDLVDGRIIAPAALLCAIAFVVVTGRLYSHLRLTRISSFMDDVCIVLAWLLCMIGIVSIARVHHYTILLAPSGLQLPDLKHFFFWFWSFVWQYNAGLALAKFSILFQYRRMFPLPIFQFWLKILFAIIAVYALWAVLGASIFACWPVQYFWTRIDPVVNGACQDALADFLSNAVLHIATDVLILLIPIPVLIKMHLPVRQRISLIVLFTVGGLLENTISIVRLVIFLSADRDNVFDVATKYFPLAVWSSIELSVGIICSSIPALKPLIVQVFPRFASASSRGTDDNVHGMTPEMSDEARRQGGRSGTLETLEVGESKKRSKDSEGAISFQGLVARVDEEAPLGVRMS